VEGFLIGAVIAVLIALVFGGVVQTFQRQPVVSILCVIFFDSDMDNMGSYRNFSSITF
jgi:hypothetical protein